MAFLAFEIDEKLLIGFIVAANQPEAPTAVNAIVTRLHSFEHGLGGLERGSFGDERLDGFRIHDCCIKVVNRLVESTMPRIVNQRIFLSQIHS